jgi:hypothetical protein
MQLDIQGISAVGIDIYGLSSDAEVLWHVCDVLDDFLQNLTVGCFQTKYILDLDDSIHPPHEVARGDNSGPC